MAKTLVQKCLLAFMLIAGAGMVSAARVEAQDCGTTCTSCGFWSREGVNYSTEGGYGMACRTFTTSCQVCGDASIGRQVSEADEIAEAVKRSSSRQLAAVARRYGGRLLINAERNMVVIQGSNCDPTALITALFVDAEQIAALKEAGVRSLQSFVAAQAGELAGKRA